MRLMVKLKKVWDLLVFFLTNVVLNGGDIISDGLTAYALCKQYFLGAKILFLESHSDSPIATSYTFSSHHFSLPTSNLDPIFFCHKDKCPLT